MLGKHTMKAVQPDESLVLPKNAHRLIKTRHSHFLHVSSFTLSSWLVVIHTFFMTRYSHFFITWEFEASQSQKGEIMPCLIRKNQKLHVLWLFCVQRLKNYLVCFETWFYKPNQCLIVHAMCFMIIKITWKIH